MKKFIKRFREMLVDLSNFLETTDGNKQCRTRLDHSIQRLYEALEKVK